MSLGQRFHLAPHSRHDAVPRSRFPGSDEERIFIFVPLLAPMAAALGVHPIHCAIVFIVNLEIGYLTPPVGLNLFVASTLFNKPMSFMTRSVLPFIGVLIACLLVITYWPGLSQGGADLVMGPDRNDATVAETGELEEGTDHTPTISRTDAGPNRERVQTLEEMMAEQEAESAQLAAQAAADADAGRAADAESSRDSGIALGADSDAAGGEGEDPEPSF